MWRAMRTLWLTGFCALLLSCAALRDDMRRAESAFEQARYEDVMVWLDDLEPNVPDMDAPTRARFYYLRGLTAYRLGDRIAARHNLALCREEAGERMAALPTDWRSNLQAAMKEMGIGPPSAQRELADKAVVKDEAPATTP
jgi:hypothetical protein